MRPGAITKPIISFIGGGNMTRALVAGLTKSNFPADRIRVSNRTAPKLKYFDELRVRTTVANSEVAKQGNVIVLSVKPFQIRDVCDEIKDILTATKPLVISVAAGVATSHINQWLGGDEYPIIRAMPNTPAAILKGTTGLFATAMVTAEQKKIAEDIFSSVGIYGWLHDEARMDSVTAVSGSGPAYIFLVMEAMQKAAEEMGLSPEMARLFTIHTVFGAATFAAESSESLEQLRKRVTSPGGTTERAIGVFESREIKALFAEAMRAAQARGVEISSQLGQLPNTSAAPSIMPRGSASSELFSTGAGVTNSKKTTPDLRAEKKEVENSSGARLTCYPVL